MYVRSVTFILSRPWRTQRCPPSAATSHVISYHYNPAPAPENVLLSHLHQCALTYSRAQRWPPPATLEHVSLSQSQSFALSQWRAKRCPLKAPAVHVSLRHPQPLALAHWSTERCPPKGAANMYIYHICIHYAATTARHQVVVHTRQHIHMQIHRDFYRLLLQAIWSFQKHRCLQRKHRIIEWPRWRSHCITNKGLFMATQFHNIA